MAFAVAFGCDCWRTSYSVNFCKTAVPLQLRSPFPFPALRSAATRRPPALAVAAPLPKSVTACLVSSLQSVAIALSRPSTAWSHPHLSVQKGRQHVSAAVVSLPFLREFPTNASFIGNKGRGALN